MNSSVSAILSGYAQVYVWINLGTNPATFDSTMIVSSAAGGPVSVTAQDLGKQAPHVADDDDDDDEDNE